MKTKKLLFFLGITLLIATSCATIPKTPITSNDLVLFKGQWEGLRTMQWNRMETKDFAALEIYNETIPLKGKLVISFLEGELRTFPFENGNIDSQGNLVLSLGDDIRSELSLFKEPTRMKLYGTYNYRRNVGTLVLYKK